MSQTAEENRGKGKKKRKKKKKQQRKQGISSCCLLYRYYHLTFPFSLVEKKKGVRVFVLSSSVAAALTSVQGSETSKALRKEQQGLLPVSRALNDPLVNDELPLGSGL